MSGISEWSGMIYASSLDQTRITMNPGKAIKQDPRSAPDKAPAEAPDAMSKSMPEYPMDANELVYPGEGVPFAASDPRNSATGGPHHPGTPAHPEAPTTEVPRNKIHLVPTKTRELMEMLTNCVAACEHSVVGSQDGHGSHGMSACISTCRACADMCKLLISYLNAVDRAAIAMMAKDLAPVCARTCEACALECSKHPDVASCVACELACRACAEECRSFAS